jgi:hypothetical protein
VTADGGGSNGYRVRLWKIELQKLANELKLPITFCHLPPGTSKWNKIDIGSFHSSRSIGAASLCAAIARSFSSLPPRRQRWD